MFTKSKTTHFQTLPTDILFELLQKSSILELIKLSNSCKALNEFILKGTDVYYSQDFWKKKFIDYFPELPLPTQSVGSAFFKEYLKLIEVLEHDGNKLKVQSKSVKEDYDLVLTAVCQRGQAIEFASDILKKNHGIILEAMETYGLKAFFAGGQKLEKYDGKIMTQLTPSFFSPLTLLFKAPKLLGEVTGTEPKEWITDKISLQTILISSPDKIEHCIKMLKNKFGNELEAHQEQFADKEGTISTKLLLSFNSLIIIAESQGLIVDMFKDFKEDYNHESNNSGQNFKS